MLRLIQGRSRSFLKKFYSNLSSNDCTKLNSYGNIIQQRRQKLECISGEEQAKMLNLIKDAVESKKIAEGVWGEKCKLSVESAFPASIHQSNENKIKMCRKWTEDNLGSLLLYAEIVSEDNEMHVVVFKPFFKNEFSPVQKFPPYLQIHNQNEKLLLYDLHGFFQRLAKYDASLFEKFLLPLQMHGRVLFIGDCMKGVFQHINSSSYTHCQEMLTSVIWHVNKKCKSLSVSEPSSRKIADILRLMTFLSSTIGIPFNIDLINQDLIMRRNSLEIGKLIAANQRMLKSISLVKKFEGQLFEILSNSLLKIQAAYVRHGQASKTILSEVPTDIANKFEHLFTGFVDENDILMVARTGSHLYGTNVVDSDEDYIVVYRLPLETVFSSIHKLNERVECRGRTHSVDISAYEVHAFLRALHYGHSCVTEILISGLPIPYLHPSLQKLFDVSPYSEAFILQSFKIIENVLKDINRNPADTKKSRKLLYIGHYKLMCTLKIFQGCHHSVSTDESMRDKLSFIRKDANFENARKELVSGLAELRHCDLHRAWRFPENFPTSDLFEALCKARNFNEEISRNSCYSDAAKES